MKLRLTNDASRPSGVVDQPAILLQSNHGDFSGPLVHLYYLTPFIIFQVGIGTNVMVQTAEAPVSGEEIIFGLTIVSNIAWVQWGRQVFTGTFPDLANLANKPIITYEINGSGTNQHRAQITEIGAGYASASEQMWAGRSFTLGTNGQITSMIVNGTSMWTNGSAQSVSINGASVYGTHDIFNIGILGDQFLNFDTGNNDLNFANQPYWSIGKVTPLDTLKASNLYPVRATSLRAAVIGPDGILTNALGSPDGTKFLRDDNTYAVPPGGSSTPGGNSGAVQFNETGAFAGTNHFTYDRTNSLAVVNDYSLNATSGYEVRFGGTPTLRIIAGGINLATGLNIGINGHNSATAPDWSFNNSGGLVPGANNGQADFGSSANGVRGIWGNSMELTNSIWLRRGGYTLATTNMGVTTNVTLVLTNAPHVITYLPACPAASNSFYITFANAPAAGSPADSWDVYIYNTNLTAVTGFWLSSFDTRGLSPVLVQGPFTNVYTVAWNGTNLYVLSKQDLTTGTGPYVQQTNAILYGATLDTYKQHRTTNYIDGDITINCSTDVSANYTNAVAANRSITLSTPVIGTSGSLSLTSDGSARTLAILCTQATITWMSTNDTASSTNILTTASKDSLFAWRVRQKHISGSAMITNIQCWVKNQTP